MSTLIYHSGALGDFIASLPLFSCIAGSSHAPITLIGNGNSISLASACGCIAKGVAVEHPSILPLFHDIPDETVINQFISPYSLILLFTGPDSPLAKNVRFYATVPVVIHPPFPEKRMPIAEYHLQVFRKINSSVTLPSPIPHLSLSSAGNDKPETDSSRPLLIIHPGSGSRLKNWPIERFLNVAAAFRKRGEVIWLTGPAEEAVSVPSSDKHCHYPSLKQCCSLLLKATVFLGNDSGIAHLAATLGIPTVVLFGPSDPLIWTPKGINRVTVLYHAQSCSPCHRAVSPRQECSVECLNSITVEEVVGAVDELFCIQ